MRFPGYRAMWTAVLLLLSACLWAEPVKPCELMKMLQSQDETVAQRGIDGFLQMGQMAAVPLVCFISGTAPGALNPNELGRRRGEEILIKLGSAAVPAALERLATQDDGFRTRLVRILGRVTDPRGAAALARLWNSETSDRVRGALAQTAAAYLKPEEVLEKLRTRIPAAGPRELRGLAHQLLLLAKPIDVGKVLARIPTSQIQSFASDVIAELQRLGTEAAQRAVALLNRLRRGE